MATASRLRALIEQGVVTPPREAGDPLPRLTGIRLPKGTAARLADEDREKSTA